MNNEIKEVLEELQAVRHEMLNENAKRLFNAIMTIVDERDEYKSRIDKAIEYMEENEKAFIISLGTHYYKLLEILRGEE